MTEILVLHSALGLRPGVHAFAAEFRAEGHTVHTPDFYEGAVFDDLDAGIDHRDALGFDRMMDATTAAADAAPDAHVFAGFSLGGWFANHLARTRPGATGLLLLHEGEPDPEHPWPAGVQCQIHAMEDDPWLEVDDLRALEQETAASCSSTRARPTCSWTPTCGSTTARRPRSCSRAPRRSSRASERAGGRAVRRAALALEDGAVLDPRGPETVTLPRTATSRPNVTSPSTMSRSASRSDGAPAGKCASKSRTSLKWSSSSTASGARSRPSASTIRAPSPST